jgi:superfamily II DNA or RNA helicase
LTHASYVAPRLTPQGHLLLEVADDASFLDDAISQRLTAAFTRGAGYGLLQLGAGEIGEVLPPAFAWWREFAGRYVLMLCTGDQPAPPTPGELASLVLTAPIMAGAEYVTPDTLCSLWTQLDEAFTAALAVADVPLETFLKTLNSAWNILGRVYFNLAENKRDPDEPFAFMATYTTRLSAQAKAQHLPLGQALREYSGAAKREKLLSLLMPVQRAAETCAWLKAMVDSQEIFHPLRWSAADASQFLTDVPKLEHAGIIVRMPANWQAKRPPRPQVTAAVGVRAPKAVGLDALLDFHVDVTLEGERLTAREIKTLLGGTESLVLLRGQWVQIDRQRLESALHRFQEIEELAKREGLPFMQAMRLLAGVELTGSDKSNDAADWSEVTAGPWFAEKLQALRASNGQDVDLGPALKGVLRPYQRDGVRWMQLHSELGLGACLADDMGLGKTIQVLALLLQQVKNKKKRQPSLLVAPASLLANWAAEAERFAPSLVVRTAHPSAMTAEQLNGMALDRFSDTDLVITSYGSLLRMPAFAQTQWLFIILDEAQAIKNRNAKQTKAVKELRAQARIALTGTPVENHLGDLWSIFDFINPGLLGTSKQFDTYAKQLVAREHNPYGPLRELVRPYILRRMKTDKAVIADLPDKTELKAYCNLSRKQAALYAKTVSELTEVLADAEGIARKGIVLATLMRLKQICNHPSQWLNDHDWKEEDSGKWARLREIAEVVAARQEKMLVFTQFREMTVALEAFLASIFGRSGLILHGEVAVKKREALVRAFQQDENVPFFILSLKAGGSGLNLTAASHVVHFDRWWNPAVENQATDRAFRIGQKKNVLVHKFVCRGTIEEKIDALIEAKKNVSDDLLAGTGEITVTEMKDDELLKLVALDLNTAVKEENSSGTL